MKLVNKVIYTEEKLNNFWDKISHLMAKQYNKQQVMDELNLNEKNYSGFVRHLSANKRERLKLYYRKLPKQISNVNKVKPNRNYDNLDYDVIIKLIESKKMSKIMLYRHLKVSRGTIENWMKYRLSKSESEYIQRLFYKYKNLVGQTKLPPNNFKKHSNFKYKEVSNNVVLPVGVNNNVNEKEK